MRKATKQYWRYFNYTLSLFFSVCGSFLIICSNDLINQFIDNVRLKQTPLSYKYCQIAFNIDFPSLPSLEFEIETKQRNS